MGQSTNGLSSDQFQMMRRQKREAEAPRTASRECAARNASEVHQRFASGPAIEVFTPVPRETAHIVAAVENSSKGNMPKLSDSRERGNFHLESSFPRMVRRLTPL